LPTRAAAVRIEVREGNPLASIQELSNISSLRGIVGFERFYEKVIKVKADVAALLNLFSDVSIDVRW